MGTVPGLSSQYGWGGSLTLRGGLRKARFGGIGYVLIPWWAKRGEDLTADRTGAIKEGMLTTTVDPEGGEALQHPTTDFSKPPCGQLWLAHLWAERWWRRVQIGQACASSLHRGAE